jgi:RecA-family ATPase
VAEPMSKTPQVINWHTKAFFFSLEEWENVDLATDDHAVLLGTPQNSIIRPGTKNVVVAPEKAFKTTTLLRLALGMAGGHTVYPSLPVARPAKVLYIHGEMTPKEIAERTEAAATNLPRDVYDRAKCNFIEGRSIDAHLIKTAGQDEIRRWVKKFQPEVLVVDPWQEFITGYDENSFKDMSQATDFLNKLTVEQNGMAVILAVHLGKNRQKGERGHSVLAGWRDTLIRITPKDDRSIKIKARPRWGEPVDLKLKFQQGTMVEGAVYGPQSARIRAFLEEKTGFVPRADIEALLGGSKDANKKAIQRAMEEQAIAEGTGENKGKFIPYVDDPFETDVL